MAVSRGAPTRRALMIGAVAAGATGVAAAAGGLRERAARRGLLYGAAVQGRLLDADAGYREAVIRECAVVVPEFEMKWGQVERRLGHPDYAVPDRLVNFAMANGLKVRGHTAIWHENAPPWLNAVLGRDGIRVVTDRVRGILGHYDGRVADWDLVNEAVEPKDGTPDGLRNSGLLKALGPDYVVEAFRAARRSFPAMQLVYNDYGIECDAPDQEARRQATLRLLGTLRAENLVDALGIQGHLKVGNRFTPAIFRRFLSQVAGMGLRILITELDVNDTRLPPDVAGRDRAVADYAARFLDTTLDEKAVTAVLTWGLTDRYTSLNLPIFKRQDGQRSRGLPLDEALQPKPFHEALATAFDRAPDRRPAPATGKRG